MSEVDQLNAGDTKYTSDLDVKTAKGWAIVEWPVVGVALALLCVVVWDLSLIWLAVQLLRITFL